MESTLTKHQVKTFGPIQYKEGGTTYRITAKVRYDDQCGNGHNSFTITGEIDRLSRGVWRNVAGGCIHDEIAKHFPQLAPFLKWHLCSSDGPMHYASNVVFLAGDRDCWGLRAGEFRQHTSRGKRQADGVEGVPHWELKLPEGQRASIYAHDKPAPVTLEWQPAGMTGEGKARELDAARRAAIWPDATDEELTAPGLEERLKARLPALLVEFRKAVESLGFVF